jgi:four helix bundle protein
MSTKENLKDRFKKFALRVINLCQVLPKDRVSDVIGKQLLRSGTSVGANYRAVCRAKSTADFIHKLQIVEEELDESLYWMELLIEAKIITEDRLKELISECNELLSIIVSSIKTSKLKKN